MDDSPSIANLKFIEKETYEKGFSSFFETEVKPLLMPLENLRLQKLKEISRRKIIAVGIIAIAIIIETLLFKMGIYDNRDGDGAVPGTIFIISMFFSIFFVKAPGAQYESQVKDTLMPLLLGFYGKFKYEQKGRIAREPLTSSGIIGRFTDYDSLDYVNGNYMNVDFQIESAVLKIKGGDNDILVFGGKILLLKINKTFSGKTIIKKDAGSLFNWIDSRGSDLKQIKLEDPKFEDKFEVYSTDQIEARYLLSPAFMERLLQLAEIYKTKAVQASFIEQNLLITFNNSHSVVINLFQPRSVKESIINTEDIHNFLAQINSIFQIIDTLNLPSHTG